MPRPPLIVIDSDAGRRNEIGQALTAAGYEVVPAATAAEAAHLTPEIGADPDSRYEALVGDHSLARLPDLLRALAAVLYSGRIELDRGSVDLAGGEVVAASAPPVRGRKALFRLVRLDAGPFRIVAGAPLAATREIHDDLQTLMAAAIEDSMGELPDPRTQVRIEIGPEFFAEDLSPEEQRIVQAAQRGADLQAVLDAGAATDGAVLDALLRLAERGVVVLEQPQPGVLVVTDSTADLPAHVARELGIEVVPLKVRFGQQTFRDGVDLTPQGFYQRLEAGGAHPTTEPPDAEDFARCYQQLDRRDVVSVHVSRKLSQTWTRAEEAAKLALATAGRRGAQAEVVDSRAVSAALGFQAIYAARMAARGVAAAAIRTRLGALSPRLHVLFVVDTLDYLMRGGRIGKARGWIGKLLGIKPILGLQEGEIVPVDRARGGQAAQDRLLELLAQRLAPRRPAIAAVIHAKAPARADRVSRLLRERFAVRELLVAELGPVLGTQVGPGMVGVVAFQPTDDEAELLAPLTPAAGGG
jgi:DegV family protein with EDD domain